MSALHAVEHGAGVPVLVLHGWFVDHRMMTGILEPLFGRRPGHRRIYVDLPGMGRTPAEGFTGSDDVLDALLALVDERIGDAPFLVVGLSYGGYLARAIASRRPGQVAGMALIVPFDTGAVDGTAALPPHGVLHSSGELTGIVPPHLEGEWAGYLVVQTPETLRRFAEREGPGAAAADTAALERLQQGWVLAEAPGPYAGPTVIVTGRQDSLVGYSAAWSWLDHYPRATFAVLDLAGHGLPHEQPGLLDPLLSEWLDRTAPG